MVSEKERLTFMLTSLLLVLWSLLKLVLVIPASSEVQGGAHPLSRYLV